MAKYLHGATVMRTNLEKILKAHGALDTFIRARSFHLRLQHEGGGLMPLVIERHGDQVTVTHYYEQNGDLISDPDMEFRAVGAEGMPELWPVAIQHATGHYARCEEERDGHKLVKPRLREELIRFANMWGRNIIEQGYGRAKADTLTHHNGWLK